MGFRTCLFCHGMTLVRGPSGEVQCPECRGTGDQAQVNNHLAMRLECARCGVVEVEESAKTSLGLHLTQFAMSHLGCNPRESTNIPPEQDMKNLPPPAPLPIAELAPVNTPGPLRLQSQFHSLVERAAKGATSETLVLLCEALKLLEPAVPMVRSAPVLPSPYINLLFVVNGAPSQTVTAYPRNNTPNWLLHQILQNQGLPEDFELRLVDGRRIDGRRALIELVQHVVHKQFALATCLRRGVAFHYGNMPLLIRDEIERLFSTGTIKYLVCTSTLIEGVNMACRNIFMRGPTKGRGHPLSAEDFWNLAGRAGRWGKEFQGNIFCIDPDRKDLWGADGPPRERTRQLIRRTTDDVLAVPSDLAEFIRERAPLDIAKKRPELEYAFSYLAGIHVRYGGLLEAPWAGRHAASGLSQLAEVVQQAVEGLAIEPDIIARNPGISPFALEGLLQHFRERQGDVEELLPADPASNDAAKAYAAIFGRLCRRACPNLGPEGGRAYMLALLVTRWMRGFPLARLIQERIDYLRKKGRQSDDAAEIRNVMNEVEQIARFEAPRGLSCYCDVLRQHLREVGRPDLIEQFPQFNVFLELGVNQQTQISLIGIGLSRTSTIAVSERITADSLTEPQVLRWLVENEELWRNFSLPALVKREIERVLAQHKVRT